MFDPTVPPVMRAMVLDAPHVPLTVRTVPVPMPGPRQLLVRVHACGVCRTDLHIVDGELPHPKLPLIPGHQIVGTVVAAGERVTQSRIGDRIGVPWLGWTDGTCPYCLSGRENLCDAALFTGYDIDGGYAEYAVADERFCFPVPSGFPDLQAAPLLCAGLIGFRALTMTGAARRLGLYGFGAAAHIICQVAVHQGRLVYAITRPGDRDGQAFATELGAAWVGDADAVPAELDAAIIFAPAGELVPAALRAVVKGGVVVCAGIHMSAIPSFSYDLLWGERVVRSVANLTRADGEALLRLAAAVPLRTQIQVYPLTAASRALADLRNGHVRGAAVLAIEPVSASSNAARHSADGGGSRR
jgi:propanol-preferring alcohol dehydrogenase